MKYKSPGRLFVPFLGLLPNHNTGLCPTSPFPPTFTASSPTQGFNILPTPLSPFSRSTPKPAASNNVCHVKVSILPLELYSCQISRMLNIISFHCIMVCNYDTSQLKIYEYDLYDFQAQIQECDKGRDFNSCFYCKRTLKLYNKVGRTVRGFLKKLNTSYPS